MPEGDRNTGYWDTGMKGRPDLQGMACLLEAIKATHEDRPTIVEMAVELLQKALDGALHPQWVEHTEEGKIFKHAEADATWTPESIPMVTPEVPATKVPSYEEVFGQHPTLSLQHFTAALKTAGYDDSVRSLAQWGAQDWMHLPLADRQEKMDKVYDLIEQNKQDVPFGNGPGPGHLSCPSGESHGEAYQNRTREGKPFYKCRVPDCHRPGSETTTTWDDSNYSKRQEEFRTGKAYQPQGQWRGKR